MLEINQTFAHFKILEKLGEGGMGAVYLAEDLKLNRKVAIKILLPDTFEDQDKQERFKREATTAAQISHANIMAIFDIGTEKDEKTGTNIDYIVMEYVQGRQLSTYFAGESLSVEETVKLAEKICSGLAAAHALNIVHRDIKADNIIINQHNEPKILDFGLAKPVEPIFEGGDSDKTESVEQELTKAGKIIGTVTYMSPEQARGEKIDTRSDIFSFGILLYRMATGEFPFVSPSQVSTIAKILETKHASPLSKNANIPVELERIIDKCLQKNPDDRYQDTRDLVVDLRNLRRQFDSGMTSTISAEIPKPAMSKTFKVSNKSAIMFSIIIVLAVVVVWAIYNPSYNTVSDVQAGENSLAILGFENKTGDPDLDWLKTGLPEILLTDLVQAQSTNIISQTRVQDCFPPENREEHTFDEYLQAAGKLGAVHVLSGSYYKLGDNIRIDARIVDVHEGKVIKTEKVVGADPFELIDSLTAKIAIALDMQDEFQNDQSVSQYTSSPEAYRYYLEGMELFGFGTGDLALDKFNKAIEADSNFALPYMRIAMTSVFSGRQQKGVEYFRLAKEREASLPMREKTLLNVYTEIWLNQNFNDAYVKMESFVNQFPDDKEGQTIFGLLIFSFNKDTTEAFAHFDKALEIDPAYHIALMQYAQIYINLEQYDEALKYVNLAKKYHPNSPDALRVIASIQARMGRLDDAIKTNLEVLDKFPNDTDVLENLYSMFIRKRDFNKARQYTEMIKRNHADDNLLMYSYYLNLSNLAIWEGKLNKCLELRKQAVDEALKSNDSILVNTAYNTLARYNNYFGFKNKAIEYYIEGEKWYNSFQNFDYYLSLVTIDSSYAPKLRDEFVGVLDIFKTRVPANLWYIADDMLIQYDARAERDSTTMLATLKDLYEKLGNQSNNRSVGILQTQLGDYQEGLERLLPFVEGEQESSNAYQYLSSQYYIGFAYEHLGNTKEAIARYQEVLKYWGEADLEFDILTSTKERLKGLENKS